MPDGRICRIVMLYELANIDAACRDFVSALGIDDMEGPADLPQIGLRLAVSWSTGIEFIAPLAGNPKAERLREILAAKGEGPFNVVYEVDDGPAAEVRAAMAGYPVRMYLEPPPLGSELHRTNVVEAALAPIAGVGVTLLCRDGSPRQLRSGEGVGAAH